MCRMKLWFLLFTKANYNTLSAMLTHCYRHPDCCTRALTIMWICSLRAYFKLVVFVSRMCHVNSTCAVRFIVRLIRYNVCEVDTMETTAVDDLSRKDVMKMDSAACLFTMCKVMVLFFLVGSNPL
jgi:hypothetical protein